MTKTFLAASAAAALFAGPAYAADFKCSGNRVEKSGSTQYTLRMSSDEIVVEKGGSTKGKSVRRGSKWYVEIGGSTQATFENGKIEKGGSSWASVSDAQRVYDCPGDIAATLWVLRQKGVL
ncbi:MAG: hypothetical protein HYZ28_17175 [Myxococcales bacterium]|nr:hypothetical protein [Myxococcales bacterium]